MTRPKLSINDFIDSCWDLTEDVDNNGWIFHMISDQWWGVRAWSEEYGDFYKASSNYHDVEETLYELLEEIKGKIK